MVIIMHYHYISIVALSILCFIYTMSMLHMLHEMLSQLSIKALCDSIYVILLKQLKFGKNKLCI
jgi:hypothetical protein